MGVAQQWIEGDEQSAAICVFTASHDDPFSHSISFSFLPSEAVAHLFFWVLFSFGCEDRLIAAATFLACNNVLLGVEKRRRSADGRGEEMLDPDISTRSINRTPPRGSLTGIVGLFTRKKTPPPFPQPLLPSRAPFFRTRIAPNVSRQLFHCCLCCHFSFREMGLG